MWEIRSKTEQALADSGFFEIATDPSGFANDEKPEMLGTQLMLPEWYEPKRAQIEANLYPIDVRQIERIPIV